MVHFFYGVEATLLYQKAKAELRRKVDITDPMSFGRYNSFHDTVQDAVQECVSPSFGGGLKGVILENCYFLTTSKEKAPSLDKDQDFRTLKDYLERPNIDTEFYLLAIGTPNKKNELVKLLDQKAHVVEVKNPTDEEYVELAMALGKEYNANIDRQSVFEVIKRSGKDYTTIINNLKKLFTYTKNVRIMDVEQLILNPIEDDVFALFDALLHDQRPTKALKICRDQFALNDRAFYSLLAVLASQLRFLYEVSYLLSLGESSDAISRELKCHPYRVSFAKKNISSINSETIIRIMADLNQMEQAIKFDLADPQTALELFICNFRKNYLTNSN